MAALVRLQYYLVSSSLVISRVAMRPVGVQKNHLEQNYICPKVPAKVYLTIYPIWLGYQQSGLVIEAIWSCIAAASSQNITPSSPAAIENVLVCCCEQQWRQVSCLKVFVSVVNGSPLHRVPWYLSATYYSGFPFTYLRKDLQICLSQVRQFLVPGNGIKHKN